MINKTRYIGNEEASFESKQFKGELIRFNYEDYYKISNNDAIRPLFIRVVSDSNHCIKLKV